MFNLSGGKTTWWLKIESLSKVLGQNIEHISSQKAPPPPTDSKNITNQKPYVFHKCTLPKFNSSPLKSYRDPLGKDRLPTVIFDKPLKLNFGRVKDSIMGIFPVPPFWNQAFSFGSR